MVPAAYAGATATELAGHLSAGRRHHRRRATATTATTSSAPRSSRALGIHYLDVGTSGGVFGLERGFCMMIGGEAEVVRRLEPIFRPWRPAWSPPSAPRAARAIRPPPELGYLHCGPAGAGHFVKMVHNGIEYGIMAAYAEGLAILGKADVGAAEQEHDAETTPLRDPGSTATTSTPPRSPRCGGAAA